MKDTFICGNCKKTVDKAAIGTRYRNHCQYCLWSKHVDISPGDRAKSCHGLMKPIGLTFKKEKPDKYGKEEKGEMMILHECLRCGTETKNRIAGDDNTEIILSLASEKDKKEVEKQLFGEKL